MACDRVIHVAVEVGGLHLDRTYEYAPLVDQPVTAGQLVEVSFAGRKLRALVLDVDQEPTVASNRIKPIRRVLGTHIWADENDRDLFRWAATRYGAAYADVIRHALPKRVIDVERQAENAGWFTSQQREPLALPDIPRPQFDAYGDQGRLLCDAVGNGQGLFFWRPTPGENLGARLVELAYHTLRGGRDVLVIVPEPHHEPADQLLAATKPYAVDLRGTQTPRMAYKGWLKARQGVARVVIAERGGSFTPVRNLGLAIVFDEANPALKELRSPRHHAREVVLERARRAEAVGIAIGTMPSGLAWRLMRERRITPVTPTRDVEREARPRIHVHDVNTAHTKTRVSKPGLQALRDAVTQGTYGIVLAARAGEGRAVVCARCGTLRRCPTCASSLGLAGQKLDCLGCGYSVSRNTPCSVCNQVRHAPLAAGATHIATELARNFTVPVVALEGYAQTPPKAPAVLVLTRGSVLTTAPGPVGAVLIPEFSVLLRRATLDAAEDALRLAFTLGHWVAANPPGVDGKIVVDVDDVTHHAVRAFHTWDPGHFWREEAALRGMLGFPPARYAIKLTYPHGPDSLTLADQVRHQLPDTDTLLGPLANPDTKRDELLIKTDDRHATVNALQQLRQDASRNSTDLRLDVDPVTFA